MLVIARCSDFCFVCTDFWEFQLFNECGSFLGWADMVMESLSGLFMKDEETALWRQVFLYSPHCCSVGLFRLRGCQWDPKCFDALCVNIYLAVVSPF